MTEETIPEDTVLNDDVAEYLKESNKIPPEDDTLTNEELLNALESFKQLIKELPNIMIISLIMDMNHELFNREQRIQFMDIAKNGRNTENAGDTGKGSTKED